MRPITNHTAAACGLVLLAGFATLASGCRSLETPEGYVQMRSAGYRYDYRAVAASGAVLATRTVPNPTENGDLAFWSAAVEHQKVDLDGLRLHAREDLRTAGGRDGVLFEFSVGSGQGELRYLVGMYVRPDRIHLLEAGGAAAEIAKDRDKLVAAMRTYRL